MPILYVYLEFMCLICVVLLQGLNQKVIVSKHGTTVIKLKYGSIRGALVKFPTDSYKQLDFLQSYTGLTYANQLRFHTPNSPKIKWKDIYPANKEGPVCPQLKKHTKSLLNHMPNITVKKMQRINHYTDIYHEDCLTLTLYVPKRIWNETEKLPVMIFVHGESYEVGTGNAYDGSVLASFGEVIVITVNYRLGVLGFLSTLDRNAAGNYAIWDLVAVLLWVKENIEQFEGDPGRVTLFGHGHGAALVNMLLIAKSGDHPDYNTLFHHVILQSGSAFSTWATSIDPLKCARAVANKVNCSGSLDNNDELVRCLRNKSAEELVKSVIVTPKYFTCFAPSTGLKMFPKNKSLEQLVEEKLEDLAATNKKIMMGITNKEAYSYFKQDEIDHGISEHRKQQIIRTYVQNVFNYHRQKIYDVLEHQYTHWDGPRNNNSRRDEMMDMLSDGQYKAPLIKMAQMLSKKTDTYLYSFGYSTSSEDYPNWSRGVHGDELPYIFGAPLVGGISPFPTSYTVQEKQLSTYMMRLWTNFAKTGNPNLPSMDNSGYDHDHWPKYDTNSQNYLHIEPMEEYGRKGPKVKQYYRAKELALWMNLIPKLDHPVASDTEGSHELDNADNMSTFDEPDRLKNKFLSIFPVPPPPLISTPYPKRIPMDPPSSPTDGDSQTGVVIINETTTPEVEDPTPQNTNQSPKQPARSSDIETSSVPLSITVAVGCSLLFLNLIIFAGIYYQRERIKKFRGGSGQISNGGDILDNRTIDRNNRRDVTPEAVNLVTTPDAQNYPKVASLNHKTPTDNPPLYSAIAKPGAPSQAPGGYTYSALSQRSSPMHTHNQNQYPVHNPANGPPKPRSNQAPPGQEPSANARPPGSDKSPKVETRVKHIPRANHQISSNNAITIV